MENNNICRCCLVEGAHRDLNTSYTLYEKKEIYSEMLQECFNIVLYPNTQNNAICEVCVKSLQDSFHFKQQVLKAEHEFLKRLTYEEQDTKPVVKLEQEHSDGDESDNYFLADTIKEESPSGADKTEIAIPQKALHKRIRSRTNRSSENYLNFNNIPSNLATSINSTDMPDTKPVKIKRNHKSKSKHHKSDMTMNLWMTRSAADKRKHRENLLTILKYSNVIPFRNKSQLGFVCGYCEATYPDPLDLRMHTEREHEKQRLDFKSSFDMTEYSVKLDVTNLTCQICLANMDNLGNFKDHIVKEHKKIVYDDIKDHMMQFKLKKGDIFDCVMCPSTYETFKMLKQHMNKHYCNYSCTKCENSFATKRSLNAHKATHQKGSFKCDLCEKIFSSRSKKHYHEKTKHLGTRSISNCQFCDTPFRSYYQRNQHMVKVHNSEAQYKCNVCDKGYILKSLLMCHIKKSHLMERNCQCTECGDKFFSNKALKAHMVRHTGERKYTCEVCQKSYARKYTLREHMRIHNNDRRFKCEVCGTSFVQKCSLKGHLLSHHGISLAASDITSKS